MDGKGILSKNKTKNKQKQAGIATLTVDKQTSTQN
jgi:hypothetical protein